MTLRDIAFVHKKRKVTREEKLAQVKVRTISALIPESMLKVLLEIRKEVLRGVWSI